MAISWVTNSGQSGISEDSYEFAMQHQMVETQTIGDVVPRREASPQERINESFSQIPPKRYDDQNNPLVWGLGEVIKNSREEMVGPGDNFGPEYQDLVRKQREQEELDFEQQRTPVEREASLEQQLGDPSQISTSTYQQFADYVHDLRVKFTGEPDKWSGKEVVGDFLDKAMSVMGGGIRRPPGGPRGGLGRGLSSSIGEERITSAAMKVGDKVYEGENHGIAYEKAGDHHPAAVVEEGFTTSKGRFVSREEAAQIAKKQEQVLLEARQTENLHSGELKYGFERIPKPPVETSQAQWSEYEKLSSQGKTTKQILKATKMDPEVVRDALGRDNLALAAFNSENALTEAYFNQLKTMPPELEKALRAKGVSVKDLKSFTRSLPEKDLARIFQQLPENVKTWWQAGELRRQKIDEGKKGAQIPKGSSEGEPLGPKPPRGTVKAGWDAKTIHEKEVEAFLAKNDLEPLTKETRISNIEFRLNQMLKDRTEFRKQSGKDAYYAPTGAIEVLKNRLKELNSKGTVQEGWDEPPKKWSDLDPLERLMKMDEVIKKNPNLRQVPWGWETEEVQKLNHQQYTKYMDEGFPETYKEHLDLIKKK